MRQTVDALWICIFRQKQARERKLLAYYHILREASASLLVLLHRAIPEPQDVERATGMALTLLFLNNLIPMCEPGG